MQDEMPYNNKQQPHGKWVVYYEHNSIVSIAYFVNNKPYGQHFVRFNTIPNLNIYYAR